MRIEIWSDVVCPWCYIGKRRLEQALETFPHADDVEIVWRSFQLDPSAPQEPIETVAEALGRKYGGGPEAGRQMVDRVEGVAAELGMTWRHHESLRVRTVDAHRVLHLALETGGPELQGRLKEALLSAYFIDTANVADADTLLRIATSVGLDEVRVKEVLAGDEYADAVEADIREAVSMGASGVPFYVVDRKYGVAGAQPSEVFTQVLERAWSESHPTLDVVGGADACGPDGCAI
jgi:predicted DsbA family dithiol-disulfide isomerase